MELLQPRQTYQRVNSDDGGRFHEHFELEIIQDGTLSHHTLLPSSESQLEPEPVQISPKPSMKARWFSGWRTGAFIGAALGSCSLVINIAAAVYLSQHSDAGSNLVQVFKGNCKTVARMDIWVHLLINALSTLLLAGSNYCMQCLCAPTRSEVDEMHLKGRYLDIGIPSLRNLTRVAPHKTIMWLLFALSSIPLHLIYNSAFYSSLSTTDYDIAVVTPDFLLNGLVSVNSSYYSSSQADDNERWARQVQQQLVSNDTVHYKRMDALSCIKAYGQVFLQDYRTLVIVSTNASSDQGDHSSLLGLGSYRFLDGVDITAQRYRPFNWVCQGEWSTYLEVNGLDEQEAEYNQELLDVPCDSYLGRIEANASLWKPLGFNLDYCLAEVIEQQCSFNGNIPIILTVIVCNVVKIALMLLVALRLNGDPLITIGDAIESFLNTTDQHTKDLCLFTRHDAKRNLSYQKDGQATWQYRDGTRPKVAGPPQTLRWKKAASGKRWMLTMSLLLLAITIVAGLLVPAIILMNKRSSSIRGLGFGTVQPATIISGWSIAQINNPSLQIITAILVANSPQVVLSLLYFSINGLLTSMWAAFEWSKYAKHRKYLRVSTRQGKQRSKHFLSLPYHISIPLLVTSGLLHWLISQSIFLAVVSTYDSEGDVINAVQWASYGFSPMAMIMVIVLASVVALGTILLGRRKYDSAMPFVGSCSVAISAACHRPDWDVDASMSMVQWGALPESRGDDSIGHCCFTSGEVEPVQVGKRYAGYSTMPARGRLVLPST